MKSWSETQAYPLHRLYAKQRGRRRYSSTNQEEQKKSLATARTDMQSMEGELEHYHMAPDDKLYHVIKMMMVILFQDICFTEGNGLKKDFTAYFNYNADLVKCVIKL